MAEQPWTVLVFRDERGREPVTDFIRSLQPEMRQKLFRNLDLLAEKGPSLPMPLSRPIPGYGLAELRVQAAGNISRVFYCTAPEQRLILLHAFMKKTSRTPQRELRIAADRREAFMRRIE